MHPAFTLVLALAAGVLAQAVARHLRVPGIVLLLFVGAGLGPDGLNWVHPEELGEGLFAIVELSVAIILFEGGLNLEISRLRREQASIRRLVLGGTLVTLLGGAVAAHLFLDWPWLLSFVFGSLVVVTGPTVIGPLIESLRLKPRVATVLEAEGVLIDPVGAILAVLLLDVALAPGVDSVAAGARVMLLQASFGGAVGIGAGYMLALLLRAKSLVPEGYENIVVLVTVLFVFQSCNEILAQSGLLAVTLAGVVVGNLRTRVDRDLREFKDQLTIMLIGMLFVLLAATVRLEDVQGLGVAGLGVVASLVFVVRPLTVWLSTDSELTWQERMLLAWIAPRGIVAAAIASVTAVALQREGGADGSPLLALVFLVIASTVLLAGLTAGPLARLLGQCQPGRDGVIVLGVSGLGLLLARELREAEVRVVFVDSNPQNCRRAEEEEFPVVFGNALQERTLQRARVGSAGTVVGLTTNQMLNSVFVSRARERFRVPRALVAVQGLESGLAPELVKEEAVQVLFDGPHDVERWDVRARQDALEVEHWEYRGLEPPSDEGVAGSDENGRAGRGSDPLVILAVLRGGRTDLMYATFQLREGDVAAVAVHAVEREAAHALLRAGGWVPREVEPASAA
ncbi:MAG: sodium:proton antiporter [Deltaproteobacteria bacterium]|nr:sodium:proton antiporter [Deltaproteobacteria bacterium]